MIYQGQFRDINDTVITLFIDNGDDRGIGVFTIGENIDTPIQFASKPIEIDQDTENSMEVIHTTSCSIKLLVRDYLGDDMFTGNSRSVRVNVFRGSTCIFGGFIEPNIYTQPYNSQWDSLELNATCGLATLQYYPYRGIHDSEYFGEVKSGAKNRTFGSLIYDCLRKIPDMNINDGRMNNIYYDGSVRLSSQGGEEEVWTDVYINELLFLGEEYDEVMMDEEVLTEILQYLDLHIVQKGCDFYIYSLQSIIKRRGITWYPICLPECYEVEMASYAAKRTWNEERGDYDVVYTEVLTPSAGYGSGDVYGNPLEVKADESTLNKVYEDRNDGRGTYVNQLGIELPNGALVPTNEYVEANVDGKFVYFTDTDDDADVKEFVQEANGDYDADALEMASTNVYEKGRFRFPDEVYKVSRTEWVEVEV